MLKAQTVTTYSYSGTVQTFTVPPCVGSMTLDMSGAQGGGSSGGLGGRVRCTFTVTPGDVLNIYVGGQGGALGSSAAGGYNGGGASGPSGGSTYAGSGGGGATDIRLNGTALSNRILVAGGGGGYNNVNSGAGGGGGTTGVSAASNGNTCFSSFATGGTQTAGGNAAQGSGSCCTFTASTAVATLGVGGNGSGPSSGCNSSDGGAGGGGGYYGGGGGGGYGAGAGGSSYTGLAASSVTHTQSYRSGNGIVTFTYNTTGAGVATTVSSNSICTGSSVTLTAASVVSYTWLPVGTFAGSNSNSISPTPSVTTTYTVIGLNSSGCTSTVMSTIFVAQAVPSLTVVNTATNGGICPTKSVAITASGANNYVLAGSSGTLINGGVFNPTVADTYTVTGFNACGSTSAITSVSVHPAPSVTPVASTSSLCSGTSLTLTGVGNATAYTWSGGATSITNGTGFSPVLTSTYTVIGTSALSCTASATIPVTVVTTPAALPVASPSLICIGKSSTITATGATTYSWTDGTSVGTNSTYVTTPTLTGITSYTIFRANSTCTTSQIVNVIVNALPTVFAISNPTGVCAGKPTTLTVAGAQTYTWTSPGAPPTQASFTFTGASPLAFPLVPSTYTVAAHDGTCVNTTTVFVHADPNPTITATASSPSLCSGSTATINATGGNNYTVTSSASTATFASFPIIETLTTTAAYNITGDNSFGCTSSISQIVQVYGNPTLTAIQNRSIVCSGGNVTVTASGANTYTWSSGATSSNTILNPVSLVTAPVIFTVSGTFTNTMCHSDKTITVTVFIPTLTVTGATSICSGGTLNLTAGGGTGNGNYRWYTVPGAPATSSNAVLNSTLSAPTVFTLTGLTTSGQATLCPSTKTLDVNIYFNPTITAVAQRSVICVNEFVVITGNGGDSYEWSTGFATNTISVNPKSNTNYTVVGKDLNGCVNSATLQIKVSGCVGVENLVGNSGLSIFPNPSNGEFSIKAAGNLKLQLMNELGQIIRNIELSGANNYKVSVNDLAKGIYFLSGEKDGQPIRQKIIVAK